MANKTEGVKILVQDVLGSAFQEPYGEDVILDVFKTIRNNPEFTRRYTELSDEMRDLVVNNWIGKHTKELTGMRSLQQVNCLFAEMVLTFINFQPVECKWPVISRVIPRYGFANPIMV